VDAAGNATWPGTPTLRPAHHHGRAARARHGRLCGQGERRGTALVYLTYLGPGYNPVSPNTNPANTVTAIAADAAGNAYVAGSTFDDAFRQPAAATRRRGGGTDAFAAELNPQGSAMVWATYLGARATMPRTRLRSMGGNVW